MKVEHFSENEVLMKKKELVNDHIVYLNAGIWYTASGGFTSTNMMIDEISAALK